MTKREFDCIFLLADKQMEYTFKGVLARYPTYSKCIQEV